MVSKIISYQKKLILLEEIIIHRSITGHVQNEPGTSCFAKKQGKHQTNVVMSKEHGIQDEGEFPLAYIGTIRA